MRLAAPHELIDCLHAAPRLRAPSFDHKRPRRRGPLQSRDAEASTYVEQLPQWLGFQGASRSTHFFGFFGFFGWGITDLGTERFPARPFRCPLPFAAMGRCSDRCGRRATAPSRAKSRVVQPAMQKRDCKSLDRERRVVRRCPRSVISPRPSPDRSRLCGLIGA